MTWSGYRRIFCPDCMSYTNCYKVIMIKIYTFMHSNPKTYEIFDFVDKVSDMTSNPSMMLVFPEISTTLSGWSYPTPPAELRSIFYKFIKQQLE